MTPQNLALATYVDFLKNKYVYVYNLVAEKPFIFGPFVIKATIFTFSRDLEKKLESGDDL